MLFQADLSLGEDPEPTPYRTRQEKWISQARNVVTTKAELKPYVFLETTCTKLGDIEKAQELLDKLENTIDSEKQYELISRTARRPPKPKSYTFSVKIAEATDLKACDMNGKSDPYVILKLDQNPKPLGKTITIFSDLNPIWNETFEITTNQASTLSLTVWDDNAYQDHSICGRTSISLDPKRFDDFVAVVSFHIHRLFT